MMLSSKADVDSCASSGLSLVSRCKMPDETESTMLIHEVDSDVGLLDGVLRLHSRTRWAHRRDDDGEVDVNVGGRR